MLFKFKKNLKIRRFNRSVRDVERTPPVHVGEDDGLLFISQVRDSDVYMYLLAIKSLLRRLPKGQVLVLDDGLSDVSRDLISRHLPGVEVRPITSVDTGNCPRGATWERLITIADECTRRFVIQADSDVLAVGAVEEVVAQVRANRSFVLATSATPDFISLTSAANLVTSQVQSGDAHVQSLSESCLGTIGYEDTFTYIRGCSAFTGFGRMSTSRKFIEKFSIKMEERIGEHWHEWGSEQVTSNFAIANSPHRDALPLGRYRNFGPQTNLEDIRLLHFIGTHRFERGVYRTLAKQEIQHLNNMVGGGPA